MDSEIGLPEDHERELRNAIDAYLTSGETSIKQQCEDALMAALNAYNCTTGRKDRPLTIMFTDIVGSSRIAQEMGDVFARQLIIIHDEIVRDAIKLFYGTEIKNIGDGMLLSFNSSVDGVKAAIYIQEKMAQHTKTFPIMPIHVRIGINVGEVIEETDGDLFGNSVNLASRICSAAGSDRIFISGIVRTRCKEENAPFDYRHKGKFAMKGFDIPIPLYEVLWNSPK